jgi:glucokinase
MSEDQVYAGIDIGGTSIKYGLVDTTGKILHKEQRPTLAEKGPMPLMHLITNIAERLLYYAAEEDFSVKYLGVGSPGAIDNRTGRVIGPSPNIEGWQGMEIGETLKDRLNLPVIVDNDVNAMSLAELRFGAASGARSAVCVTVGTGVGGAVIINGRVWHGANFTAGELGHMTINFDGPKCTCGNYGCIEAYCSSQAIIDRTKHKVKGGLTPILEEVLERNVENLTVKKLFAALKKGDAVAQEVILETAKYLGIGLAGVANLLNPEIIVIGGGITEGGGGFIEAVADEIKKHAFSSAYEKLSIAKAVLGNDAGFIGAGLLGDVEAFTKG